MLIRFKVKNFLSFSQREDGSSQEFSLLKGDADGKEEHLIKRNNPKLELLKFSAVFGANASGKSNLVKALAFMQQTVRSDMPLAAEELYCKCDPQNKDRSSYFEAEILLNDRCYAYGFEVLLAKRKIISEWLMDITEPEEKILFCKQEETAPYQFDGFENNAQLKSRLEIYAEDLIDSKLFLTSLVYGKRGTIFQNFPESSVMQEVYSWFALTLKTVRADEIIAEDMISMMRPDALARFGRLLKSFGTGIRECDLEEISWQKAQDEMPKALFAEVTRSLQTNSSIRLNQNPPQPGSLIQVLTVQDSGKLYVFSKYESGKIEVKNLIFRHEGTPLAFSLKEESDGTARIFELIKLLILYPMHRVYFIDELDRCLHPNLTFKYIKTYFELAKALDIQLIVTCHTSSVMDFDLLRRDEIWFTDKNEAGETNIYSLNEFNARFDNKIEKAYLEGRYGGVPIFTTVFPPLGDEDERAPL